MAAPNTPWTRGLAGKTAHIRIGILRKNRQQLQGFLQLIADPATQAKPGGLAHAHVAVRRKGIYPPHALIQAKAFAGANHVTAPGSYNIRAMILKFGQRLIQLLCAGECQRQCFADRLHHARCRLGWK